MNRVRNILKSTSTVESKRITPALFRGGFVLILALPLLLTASLTPRGVPIPHVLQFLFYLFSLIGLILLAGYATFEFIGTRTSGATALIALTGISPGEWCLANTAEVWRTFLMIWVVRLPFLAWLVTMGNLNGWAVLHMEILYLALFAWLSSLGLILGSGSVAKGITFGVVWGGYILWEVISNLGILFQAIAAYNGAQLIPSLDGLIQGLIHLSVFRKVLALVTGGFRPDDLVLQTAVLSTFTGYCLWSYSRTIFSEIGATTLGIDGETAAESPVKQKRMPRCWPDALAWQACYYHQNGMTTIKGRAFAYVLFIAAILVMNYFGLSVIEYGFYLCAGAGLIMSPIMAANLSLAHEVKEQTLPSLSMACSDPIEIYKGWQRSWRRTAIPDLLLLPGVLAAISWSSPLFGYYVATGIIGIACIGPTLFVSSFLSAWNWTNIFRLAGSFLVVGFIAGLGALIGWAISWFLLPIVALPLLYAFGQWVLYQHLPKVFDPLLGSQKS
ncbi:hypothetical protein [Thalassoglobus sp.]|uniref:hypothetical protein n=1 Tax=Thalassoglobus sp. TaxID=2795869 RepID=UPI003AA8CDF7